MNEQFKLTDKIAIITGSSKGIGRSAAESMAKLGAKVVITARNLAPCKTVAQVICEDGSIATAIACDVSNKTDVENLIEETVAHFGGLDILVCNAGFNPMIGPLSALSDDQFDLTMNINVRSNLWLANTAASRIEARGGGSIVMVSSIAGIR